MDLGDLDSSFFKCLFTVHLKQSNFWPSADVNPLSNDPMHAMP
jgi:hypothetical protein